MQNSPNGSKRVKFLIFLYFSAGEWFKEELRELGGLDHLVKTMSDCVGFLMADEISVWTEQLQNKLRKAGRVLKVLESVSTRFHELFWEKIDFT